MENNFITKLYCLRELISSWIIEILNYFIKINLMAYNTSYSQMYKQIYAPRRENGENLRSKLIIKTTL